MSLNQLTFSSSHKASKSLDLVILCSLCRSNPEFHLISSTQSAQTPQSPLNSSNPSSRLQQFSNQITSNTSTLPISPNFPTFSTFSTFSNPSSPSSANLALSPQFKSPFQDSCTPDKTCKPCETCTQCLNSSLTYKLLSKTLQNEKELLEKSSLLANQKLKKTNFKLKSRIADLESVITKLKHSCKFTSESLSDYTESCFDLKAKKKELKEKNYLTNKEVLRQINQLDSLKIEENSVLGLLEREKSNSAGLKKKLIDIRNDLARLQDSNFEKIQKIEEVRLEIREFHNRNIGRRKTKIKSLIDEDCKQLELIKEENEKIGEIINLTEESSRTGSVVTMEEVSTSHEDEESIKEYTFKIQEQHLRICNLRLELEHKRQDINGNTCKCIVI